MHSASDLENLQEENRQLKMSSQNNDLKDYRKMTASDIGTDYQFKRKIVWFNAIGFLLLHLAFLCGFYFCFYAHPYTLLFALATALASGLGVTVGAHRHFAHKSYKAKFVMRMVLLVLHTIAGQNCMYIWVRDHRLHHLYSDTDADPHNSNRGFFFSHVGWLMCRKHPAVLAKSRTLDLSDLESDFFIMFQKEYYKPLYMIFAIALPVGIPVGYWNETYIHSIFVSFFFRYILVLNCTWLVNSAAHMFGTRPFDETMSPRECQFVSTLAFGEGWHNYHHVFPWDYRAAEFGSRYSLSTFVINICALLGLAYDLKVAPYSMVEHRIKKTGDGTHYIFNKEDDVADDQIIDNKLIEDGHEEKLLLEKWQESEEARQKRLSTKG